MFTRQYLPALVEQQPADPTPDGIAQEGREKLFHLGSGDRLLDVGCGTGKLTSHYYTANFRECIGVERSPTMRAEARRTFETRISPSFKGPPGTCWKCVDEGSCGGASITPEIE